MDYGQRVTLPDDFVTAVTRVKDALASEGFGVLTEIDIQATMKAKLGEDMEDYVVLGACNPPLAHRALGSDRSAGLLLPCNVAVRTTAEGTLVEALDPHVISTLSDAPELKAVADEAAVKLGRVLTALMG